MKVLVTGGRRYADEPRLFAELDAIHRVTPITLIVHGGGTGADALAEVWSVLRGIVSAEFGARWRKHDRAAGPIRNSAMVALIRWDPGDICLSFPGGSGTADCTGKARAAGLEVREIR